MKNFLLLLFLSSFISWSQINWGPSIDVAGSSYGSNFPRIVLNGNDDPVICWGGSSDMYVSSWNGTAFTTPVQVNEASQDVLEASTTGPDIASFGDTIYALFKQTPVLTEKIYVAKSTDGGLSFGTPVAIDDGTYLTELTNIGTDDSGNPVVVYNQFDAGWANPRWVYTYSSDFGASFMPDTLVSGGASNPVCECCPAAIDVSGDEVAVAFRDNASNIRDTYVSIAYDGLEFTAEMDVDQQGWYMTSCPTSGPDLQIVGDEVYTTYMNASTGVARVYYSKSTLSTATGSSATPLSEDITGLSWQNFPRLAIDGAYGVIVWTQLVSGEKQLALTLTTAISSGFSTSSYEIVVPSGAASADVQLSGDQIHLTWRDQTSGIVKYKNGTISGVSVETAEYALVEVLPNPAHFGWLVKIPEFSAQTLMSVLNASGEIVYQTVLNSANHVTEIFIQNENWAVGTYILQLVNDSYKSNYTLVKK